jgi:ribosome hibernation promoting factor
MPPPVAPCRRAASLAPVLLAFPLHPPIGGRGSSLAWTRAAARIPRRQRVSRPARRDPRLLEDMKESLMNLHLTGHHLEITPAIRAYVVTKLERVTRHFDHVIDVSVVLTVDKLQHKVEANVHVRGKDIHAQSIDADMYAAIDALADKLDRQILKHKELVKNHRIDSDAIKSAAAGSPPEGGA